MSAYIMQSDSYTLNHQVSIHLDGLTYKVLNKFGKQTASDTYYFMRHNIR